MYGKNFLKFKNQKKKRMTNFNFSFNLINVFHLKF